MATKNHLGKQKKMKLKILGKDECKEQDDHLTADERIALELYTATRKGKSNKTDVSEDEDDRMSEGDVELGRNTLVSDNNASELTAVQEEDDRRGITYQIFKNQGLAPKRNKDQRNPRVKHRHKFEKAKVRRKGQVRTLRTETKRYAGEASGINMRVKKGVKLM